LRVFLARRAEESVFLIITPFGITLGHLGLLLQVSPTNHLPAVAGQVGVEMGVAVWKIACAAAKS